MKLSKRLSILGLTHRDCAKRDAEVAKLKAYEESLTNGVNRSEVYKLRYR